MFIFLNNLSIVNFVKTFSRLLKMHLLRFFVLPFFAREKFESNKIATST